MKKKRVLYCNCGKPTETYRKGKKHKIIVCHNCGIIASNPLPIAALAATLAPTAIEAISTRLSKPKTSGEKPPHITYDNLDKPNKGERYVKMALKGC